MEIEASRYHATFVAKPIKAGEFLKTVSEMLSAVRRQRRWPRKRVVGGFRVTAAGRTAAVVDVSYGGLRLELPDRGSLPKTFDVEVAGIGLHLEVEPVWSYPSHETGGTVCGAAISRRAHPRRPHLARHRRSLVGVSRVSEESPNPEPDHEPRPSAKNLIN